MKAKAICGKLFQVEEGKDHTREDICLKCPETNCAIYAQYVYAVTHSNNPR